MNRRVLFFVTTFLVLSLLGSWIFEVSIPTAIRRGPANRGNPFTPLLPHPIDCVIEWGALSLPSELVAQTNHIEVAVFSGRGDHLMFENRTLDEGRLPHLEYRFEQRPVEMMVTLYDAQGEPLGYIPYLFSSPIPADKRCTIHPNKLYRTLALPPANFKNLNNLNNITGT